ncbi:coiled-coil domain-containing protein 30 [Xiphias gladius]|uniref:coiled-coil domain-containing protein 30 n=1 Tax=Xiphias gladius TaxID=8245 RepID=UPI001A97EFFE|nr:coiled-coil domain-containing protein 30 [Xiphias gladius]
MDQPEEELEQIATWFSEEGLAPDSPKEAQLCLLWRALQRTRSCLSSVTRDQDAQRSQHLAEMAEVRKSLEQIRIFTEHKDVLAQEIQDENEVLKDQLRQLISHQDAQISEVAKMLHQQGLEELIHSSPSEQVAYLLVERASLLETSEDPNNLTGAGNTSSLQGTETQMPNSNARQSPHKGVPRHGQSPWRRLFGLHTALKSKHTFIAAEARHLTGQSSSVERKCSSLERDLEEGSRRLAMAHNEIRRLTDELESAYLTKKAYEPELLAAQQELEKLKKYEMVEVRKAKELNDRLDLEIRALRSRVRSLDAERNSLQQTVVSLRKEVKQVGSALRQQQQQQQAGQQLLTVQVQVNQATELAKINSLKQHGDNSHKDLDNLIATICTNESNLQDQKSWKHKEADLQHYENTHWQLEDSFTTEATELQTQLYKKNTLHEECPDYQEAVRNLSTTQDECETLKREICETLKCLDNERSKYHEMKEKQKAKLYRAKQKFVDETTVREEKIKSLAQELSLCSHSLAKEKELVRSITAENEKLLVERTRLLQQLNEEEHDKKDSNLTAALSKCRVDFLEMENKKLGNKIVHTSNQLAVLERTLQNMQSLHFAEELKKIYNPQQIFTSPAVQTSCAMMPKPSEIQTLSDDTQSSDTKQTDVTSSQHCLITAGLSQSGEMGYPNPTSAQSRSDPSAPPAALSSSESLTS